MDNTGYVGGREKVDKLKISPFGVNIFILLSTCLLQLETKRVIGWRRSSSSPWYDFVGSSQSMIFFVFNIFF